MRLSEAPIPAKSWRQCRDEFGDEWERWPSQRERIFGTRETPLWGVNPQTGTVHFLWPNDDQVVCSGTTRYTQSPEWHGPEWAWYDECPPQDAFRRICLNCQRLIVEHLSVAWRAVLDMQAIG